LTIYNSTFNNNHATGDGGAINVQTGGVALISNSTFYQNTADGNGGAINQDGSPVGVVTLKVVNSTFSENGATTGGSINTDGIMKLCNDIVANSTSGGECTGAGTHAVSAALIESGGCGYTVPDAFISIADPMLGSLQDNGGSTFTMALDPSSPALTRGLNFLL